MNAYEKSLRNMRIVERWIIAFLALFLIGEGVGIACAVTMQPSMLVNSFLLVALIGSLGMVGGLIALIPMEAVHQKRLSEQMACLEAQMDALRPTHIE